MPPSRSCAATTRRPLQNWSTTRGPRPCGCVASRRTVVISDVPLDVLLDRLRELGAAPVVEAPDGTLRLARREVLRARDAPQARGRHRIGAAERAGHCAALGADRRDSHRDPSRRPSRGEPAGGRLPLCRAGDTGVYPGGAPGGCRVRQSVWIGVRRQPRHDRGAGRRPGHRGGGWLSAYDHRTEEVRSFAVHRIAAVRPLDR